MTMTMIAQAARTRFSYTMNSASSSGEENQGVTKKTQTLCRAAPVRDRPLSCFWLSVHSYIAFISANRNAGGPSGGCHAKLCGTPLIF